jgi:hypothetical protein
MGSENQTGLYALPPDPELADLYRVWARKIGLAIRTAVPGTVTAYNPTTQEASVRCDYLQVQRVTQQVAGQPDPSETNQERASAPILLTNVPVCPAGAGDGESYLTFPITPGCTGVLVVLDRSKDTWVNRTASVAVDPVKSAIHSLADCVFFPGLTDRAHRIAVSAGTSIAAVLESSQVYLGKEATPTSSVTIGEQLIIAVDAMLAALVAAGAGNAFTGAGTAQAAWNAAKDAIKSSKVKVAP